MTPDVALARLLERGRRERAYPMASAWVAHAGRVVAQASVGGATERTRFDVASLTKPMVVVTLAMRGVSEGWLDLAAPLAPDLPATITPYALLGHRTGMPAWKDLVAALPPPREAGSAHARYAVDALVRQAAREADPARGVEYSDLGFILLGRHLEALLGTTLDAIAPVGAYRPLAARPARGVAPTGWCPWRERELRGEVHDPNAWVMGGVAGHAGLFATAAEVGRWALALERLAASDVIEATPHSTASQPMGSDPPTLQFRPAPQADLARKWGGLSPARSASARPSRQRPRRSPTDGIDPAVVRYFWDPAHKLGDATWVLGWDTPSATGSSAGADASRDSVGHLGFTGTSVWIDRAARLVTVLLTDRVALGAASHAHLKAFRPRFHDAARAIVAVERMV